MKTIYLDQNKWIELAQAAGNPQAFPKQYELLLKLTELDAAGSAQIPLTFGNIYETYKIGSPLRRFHLAAVMSNLSWGVVFRSRKQHLKEELRHFFSTHTGLSAEAPPPRWFVSSNFLEAAANLNELGEQLDIPADALSFIERSPNEALLSYLTHSAHAERLEAVMAQSAGLSGVQTAIEMRRASWQAESMPMRKRGYGALLFLENQQSILEEAAAFGLLPQSFLDKNGSLARKLMTSVPTFDVERELVVRLEGQSQAVTENDLRDMANFVAAVPYADVVVGEKAFVSLARQAALDVKYKTTLLSELEELDAHI